MQRYCKLVVILLSCRKLLCLSAGKKSTSSTILLCRYCKDMQTYFGYFGHACSYSPKMIVSSCGRLRYLSAYKIWTASFTFFLRYYILKNLAIWLAGSILAITRDPKFCQICWSNINHNISSRFRLFTRKTNITKFFKKYKNPYFGAILDSFCPNLGKYEFSWKKKRA